MLILKTISFDSIPILKTISFDSLMYFLRTLNSDKIINLVSISHGGSFFKPNRHTWRNLSFYAHNIQRQIEDLECQNDVIPCINWTKPHIFHWLAMYIQYLLKKFYSWSGSKIFTLYKVCDF